MRWIWCVGLIGACPAVGWCEPIVTDRPGNGNAASTVAPGRLNVESGFLVGWTDATDDVTTVSFPVGLRLGLTPWLEARVLTSLVGIETVDGSTDVSATDTGLGVKLGLTSAEGWIPDLALMTDVFLPSGAGGFTNDAVVPEARAAVAWALPAGFGLFGNVGVDVPEDGEGRFARFIHVAQVNFAVPRLPLGLFVETFGRTSFDDRSDLLQLDAGLAWLVHPDLQFDLFTQHRIDGPTPDFQVSVGVSGRVALWGGARARDSGG
jgi:hypothetical protein